MADRSVKVLQQGRVVTRGAGQVGQRPVVYLDQDEKLDVSVDWSDWLGSDTISSVENETTNVTVSSASNTTTTSTLTMNSRYGGYIQHRITTAAGLIKELTFEVKTRQDHPRRSAGYGYWAMA